MVEDGWRSYLEVEDDGPYEAQYHRGSPIHQVGGIDVNELYLKREDGSGLQLNMKHQNKIT